MNIYATHTHRLSSGLPSGMGCPWLTPKPLGSSGVRGKEGKEGVAMDCYNKHMSKFSQRRAAKSESRLPTVPWLLLLSFSLSISLCLFLFPSHSLPLAVGVTISSRSNGHLRANYWIWSVAGDTQKLNPIISLRPLATPLGATRADRSVCMCRCACVYNCVCVCVWRPHKQLHIHTTTTTTITMATKEVYNATKFHFNEKLLFMQPYRGLAQIVQGCPNH